jgi:hypothetical protein
VQISKIYIKCRLTFGLCEQPSTILLLQATITSFKVIASHNLSGRGNLDFVIVSSLPRHPHQFAPFYQRIIRVNLHIHQRKSAYTKRPLNPKGTRGIISRGTTQIPLD